MSLTLFSTAVKSANSRSSAYAASTAFLACCSNKVKNSLLRGSRDRRTGVLLPRRHILHFRRAGSRAGPHERARRSGRAPGRRRRSSDAAGTSGRPLAALAEVSEGDDAGVVQHHARASATGGDLTDEAVHDERAALLHGIVTSCAARVVRKRKAKSLTPSPGVMVPCGRATERRWHEVCSRAPQTGSPRRRQKEDKRWCSSRSDS